MERNEGCPHMMYEAVLQHLPTPLTAIRCRCGTAFCYICGARHGTCRCKETEANIEEEIGEEDASESEAEGAEW